MKKPLLPALLLAACLSAAQAQTTWSEHVAPIFFEKCGSCHHDGGAGPFDITDYAAASSYATAIRHEVEEGSMPPWPPDPAYRSFCHERVLAPSEKAAILDWVDGGALPGDLSQAPAPPPYPTGAELPGTPDLVLQIPTYTLGSPEDEYRCFVIPSGLLQDKFITAWEVVPGNRPAVHHVIAYQDQSGQCAAADAATPAPGYTCFGQACDEAVPLGAWAPGSPALTYPPGMGIRLNAGADMVIEMHYPGGHLGEKDSTELHLFFAPSTGGMREVYFGQVADPFETILNGPFSIPANQVKTFNTKFTLDFPQGLTVLRLLPHMHLLGKSMEAVLVNPGNDSIPLIRIPHWDFHWQGQYTFPQLVHMKHQGKVFTQFTYDNTTANEHNPNNPPQTVGYGEFTTDEMMFLFVEYLEYLPGDENITTCETASPAVEVPAGHAHAELFPCEPNPSAGLTRIPFYLPEKQRVSVSVFDAAGRLVAQPLAEADLAAGSHSVEFSGKLSAGLYFARLACEKGVVKSSKFAVR